MKKICLAAMVSAMAVLVPGTLAQQIELKADLDPLLNFQAFWTTPAEKFEQMYVPRIEGRQEKPPQFEWLDASKSRARFSRQMFVDVKTELNLFGGVVKAEEAVVEFSNGRASRATVFIYNRGDSGQISIGDFEGLFRRTGQELSRILKAAPKRQLTAGASALKTVTWAWTTPAGIALLEHNDFQSALGAPQGKPEFLRLKLAAPDQADWSMGRISMGVQRMAIQKNVVKEPQGDVFISGVPMVDQGAKGYCVAASCQRLFEYMRIPCDQHELAQLLSADADKGVNALVMQKSLTRLNGRFGTTFKPIVDPTNYYSGRSRRVSFKRFESELVEQVGKGTPLLWALELGMKDEVPPLPAGGQVSGGHMRMIIGYNNARNQVIFTDSWGAGHERKYMNILDAYEVTLGLYTMMPRGF